MGVVSWIATTNYETRFSILKNKLYRDGVVIEDEIVDLIAKNIKSNIRELEGAIISLIAQSSFNKLEVTIELAKEIVEKFGKNTKREVSIDYIQKVVSNISKWMWKHFSQKQKRHCTSRQLAMYFEKIY